MSKAPESVATGGRVAFQVERVEIGDGHRFSVQGRWSGVRGRRFMRPALTVIVDGRPVRLLAALEHKPWAAEDSAPWLAEFPCEFEAAEVQEAELTVAPDITVALPLVPDASGKRRRTRPTVTTAPARSPVTTGEPPRRRSEARSEAHPSDSAHLRRQLAELQEERRALRDELVRLQTENSAVEARAADLAAALEEISRARDEIRRERDRLAGEREAAQRARDQAAVELDAARRDRDAAVQASQATREGSDRDRGVALAAQARAESDRDAAAAARDQALAERDAALTLRAHALAERDAATAARDKAMAEHDGLRRNNERLQSQLADQISARRGAALVIRRAAQEPPASRPFALIVPRAIALIVLLAIVLGVLAALKVI